MDIFTFIKSVNKVAIAAFFLTGSIVLYEIYLFIKQGKSQKIPKIPELQKVNLEGLQKTLTVVKQTDQKTNLFRRPNYWLVIGLVAVVGIAFGVFGVTKLTKTTLISLSASPSPTPVYREVTSEGIKIYDRFWRELTKDQLRFAKTGDQIFIGVKNIAGADIVKARIRVNASVWTTQNETSALNQSLNLFYQPYQIASQDSRLKIEAQLYSQSDGWPDESI